MGKLHREMRPWRAHLKESRLRLERGIVPKDIVDLIYGQMADDLHNVPLSDDERAAYLSFVHKIITEMGSKWFDNRESETIPQASELQKKLSKDRENLRGFGEEGD